MATDPNDIKLNEHQKSLLAELADEKQRDWREVFDALINIARLGVDTEQYCWLKIQQEALAEVWENEYDAVFDDL